MYPQDGGGPDRLGSGADGNAIEIAIRVIEDLQGRGRTSLDPLNGREQFGINGLPVRSGSHARPTTHSQHLASRKAEDCESRTRWPDRFPAAPHRFQNLIVMLWAFVGHKFRGNLLERAGETQHSQTAVRLVFAHLSYQRFPVPEDGVHVEIGRAHVRTPVTPISPMPSS